MHPPKVSVIIGAYNCEKFIEETVQSVIDQTFKDWELIVVDDCSTDSTGEKIRAISDRRIRIIRLDANSGRPAVPRNVGIKNSRGEYIAFLDHDDIWLPVKLERQVRFMEQNSDVFLLYSRCFIQKDGNIIDIAPARPKAGSIFCELFLADNLLPCSTAMMRNRKDCDLYLFNEDRALMAIEDYDLWLSIAYRNKVAFIEDPLAIYRIHSRNTSSEVMPFFKRMKIVIKKYGHLVPKTVLLRKYLYFYYNLCRNYVKIKTIPSINGGSRP